jgi:hypothetical protein
MDAPTGALPTLIVVGAMKSGTSALHEHLDSHPDITMSRPKELNFFNGAPRPPDQDPARWWVQGQWHRGVDWYASQFDAAAPARGEWSPSCTSPSFPEVASRMARVVPAVRLLYVVRDPFTRALSQYAHHWRDGDETRPPEDALLDPSSQYVARSRFFERLRPFLRHFSAGQLHVVVQERLLAEGPAVMRHVYDHVGVDPVAVPASRLDRRVHQGGSAPEPPRHLKRRFWERVADDVDALRHLMEDDLHEWAA